MIKKDRIAGFQTWFLYFWTYCVLGWCYEVFLEVVVYRWGFSNRGFLWGPYLPVYGVGALLIAIADPWKALGFIVLFLVLQQVEGNLIYPHVVGSSVGLPSIWVLAAVTLGGSLMGILGMLVFIPLCSVLYALFRDYVKTRLSQRHVPVHKWRDDPGGPPN